MDERDARRKYTASPTATICMDEPIDYRLLADHLARTRGLPSVEVPSPHFSTWLDNTKAKLLLGGARATTSPESWEYERAPDDPRRVWYPGDRLTASCGGDTLGLRQAAGALPVTWLNERGDVVGAARGGGVSGSSLAGGGNRRRRHRARVRPA